MYAVIETGGKQYRVTEGSVIEVEKLDVAVGKKVTFEHVLILGEGKSIKVGTPYLNTPVIGKVLEHFKGEKVVVYKYKAKKDYRKKNGHRQPLTRVEIVELGAAAPKTEKVEKVEAKAAAPKAEAKAPAKKAAPKKETAAKTPAKKTTTAEASTK